MHVRATTREQLLPVLDEVLAKTGFNRSKTIPITAKGPFSLAGHDQAVQSGPYYLVSPQNGDWLTLIEAHFALDGAPELARLATRFSMALSTYALALIVHDDDLFFYNLEHNGESLDGYNSCPQYFENTRLSETEVEEQRHAPDAFAPLLASSVCWASLQWAWSSIA
ncbi:MAG: hypothetical protein HY290_33345 [Planctomycetia bacterium]|nr:hypothetical protein [Planctomycetia bacterium]